MTALNNCRLVGGRRGDNTYIYFCTLHNFLWWACILLALNSYLQCIPSNLVICSGWEEGYAYNRRGLFI